MVSGEREIPTTLWCPPLFARLSSTARPNLPLAPLTPSFIVITFQSLRTKCSLTHYGAFARPRARVNTDVPNAHGCSWMDSYDES
jgi:hypothetical protein